MSVDIHLIGKDYTADELKYVALDPATNAVLVKDISPAPTDHGALSGLGDDDHPHYYNAARHTLAVHDTLGLLKKAGGVMTGLLTLSGAPTLDLHASTKKYIDDKPVGGRDKQNLVVKVNASYPASRIDIDADILQVEDENLSSINLTVNIAALGANGRDAGSEAANTWYSIWVIRGTSGTAGLLSTSATSPTMPAGYTKKRRVGWVRNDAASSFLKFYQIGGWWHWVARHTVLDAEPPASSFTDVNCSNYAPPTAGIVSFYMYMRDDAYATARIWLRRNGITADMGIVGAFTSTPRIAHDVASCPCDSNQIIEYHADNTTDQIIMHVIAYYDPI